MRPIVYALALTLAVASSGNAQEFHRSEPLLPERAVPAPVEARIAVPEVQPPAVRAEAVEVRDEVIDAQPAQELSARNLFAIVGILVVIVAVIALLS